MRIGFDGKRITRNLTGLGNYSRYVLRILKEFYPENLYTVYAVRPPLPELVLPEVSFHYPDKHFFKSWWRSYGIISDLKHHQTDLYHGLSNEIPFSLKKAGIPSVVTMHDLIFMRYPEYYSFPDRKIYEMKSRYAALNANKVIAVSEQTKRDLVSFFGAKEENIEVIYQNCDPIFHQKVTENEKHRLREKYNLPAGYLLNVGTIEERKNLMLLVKALNGIKGIPLVVIGRDTPYTRKVKDYIRANGLEERVHFLKNVPHHDLPGIYQQAAVFIYPSRFEGFGIPVTEALHSGIPVIAARGSCLEEAGGPASLYVDPDDTEELAAGILNLLENPAKRIEMISAGYNHLKKFEDQALASRLFTLYKNTINNA